MSDLDQTRDLEYLSAAAAHAHAVADQHGVTVETIAAVVERTESELRDAKARLAEAKATRKSLVEDAAAADRAHEKLLAEVLPAGGTGAFAGTAEASSTA